MAASSVVTVEPGTATEIFDGVESVLIKKVGARAYLGAAGVTRANGFPINETIRTVGPVFAFVESTTGANATFYILADV